MQVRPSAPLPRPAAAAVPTGNAALWCTELELAGPLPSALRAPLKHYGRARLLIRLHGAPMGFLTIGMRDGEVQVADLLSLVEARLLRVVNEHLSQDGVEPARDVGRQGLGRPTVQCPSRLIPEIDVSVVVCTRNRPDILRECLGRLARLSYPRLEILIVDNAPSDEATLQAFRDVVGADPRFRYLREPRPGLSCARNLGLREAVGDLIAYTDDDVTVDPDWVRALAAGFGTPDVACVTGLVCTASIDGPAEQYFDARVSWGERCQRRVYRLAAAGRDGLFPYSPAVFGTGASFAFRADVLRELGGFDEALGAGTATNGGEDLDAFVRIVLAGYAIGYEPSALVWHHHRADLAGLGRQMYSYGTGLSAFLAKHLLDPATRRQVLRRLPSGMAKLVRIGRHTHRSLNSEPPAVVVPAAARPAEVLPAGVRATPLLLRELVGFLVGPALYLRARRSIPPTSGAS